MTGPSLTWLFERTLFLSDGEFSDYKTSKVIIYNLRHLRFCWRWLSEAGSFVPFSTVRRRSWRTRRNDCLLFCLFHPPRPSSHGRYEVKMQWLAGVIQDATVPSSKAVMSKINLLLVLLSNSPPLVHCFSRCWLHLSLKWRKMDHIRPGYPCGCLGRSRTSRVILQWPSQVSYLDTPGLLSGKQSPQTARLQRKGRMNGSDATRSGFPEKGLRLCLHAQPLDLARFHDAINRALLVLTV